MSEEASPPTSLIRDFKFDRLLNQDQAGRRSVLCGHINSKPCLLILERAPFPTSSTYLSSLPTALQSLENLGANDIYFWYLANNGPSQTTEPTDLKINLIYPCTEQHIKKYSKQGVRVVTETPQIYNEKIRPYMQAKRDGGRLNWVFNIIEGKTEVEDVIYRTPQGRDGDEGFLLLPDLNWDRKTMEGLHLLGLVERRDIWSLRDLKKKHIKWLRDMRQKFLEATVKSYEGLEEDQLKFNWKSNRAGEYNRAIGEHGGRRGDGDG
ncbi:hypothetical protein EYC84_000215 [Monilinia fructicola]|uniref:Uncharacterized protein n=1 Tax=Monilinia fructicola TaxID=38448 RepID=A0A5M9JQX9_MONFR|nr:hypothetical protein EYC84_000215 [Monilinia fructicola]